MSATINTGFFAYASNPPSIGEAIKLALETINSGGNIDIKTWERMKIGGKIVIDQICKEITYSRLFCADVTNLNPNVMFELGYAIGGNKRIWLVRDSSYVQSNDDYNKLKLLTTVGYDDYSNSENLISAFYREDFFSDLDATVFNRQIVSGLKPNNTVKLFYLKSLHETDASLDINRLVQKSTIPQIIDDPAETNVNSLSWYGEQVYSAVGVICHLSPETRSGARLHNAKCALIAGMAYGMDKPLLMLSEGQGLAPIDYREILKQYARASEAAGFAKAWLSEREQEYKARKQTQVDFQTSLKLATELKSLHIGEYVAESEEEGLVSHYFVDTQAYADALDGKESIFVGRKGAGKSANLIKLASELRKDARNIVCVIKPETYEFHSIVKLLSAYQELDLKGFVIESLWKFIILTEIANATLDWIESRPSASWGDDENRLINLMDRDDETLRADISIRLERCVERLLADERAEPERSGVEGARIAVSEALHSNVLNELRSILGNVLTKKNRVAVLIDNLDRAWDKQSDLSDLSRFLTGLIGMPQKIMRDLRRDNAYFKRVNITLAMFLRSDIFYKVMDVVGERDKISYSKINWHDGELLLRIIDERFYASYGPDGPLDELWSKFFCKTVHGVPLKEYVLGRILHRPRDIVYFIKSAVTVAVNRKHQMVEEVDILEAEKQYSEFAVDSILVENGVTVDHLLKIIYEFAGSNSYLSQTEVELILSKANVDLERQEYVIRHLCSLSFLGIEVNLNDYRFVEDQDPREYQKIQALASKFHSQTNMNPRFMVNKPFWAYLEIKVGGSLPQKKSRKQAQAATTDQPSLKLLEH